MPGAPGGACTRNSLIRAATFSGAGAPSREPRSWSPGTPRSGAGAPSHTRSNRLQRYRDIFLRTNPGPAAVDPAATDPAELSDDELDSQTQALWAHVHVAMGRAVALQAENQPQGAVGDVGCAEPRAVAVVARRAVEYPAEFVDGA
jgi:hypothetical protein